MSIAMRDTALADNRQTRRMPAATVNGRFNENSARDIGGPVRAPSYAQRNASSQFTMSWHALLGKPQGESRTPFPGSNT
jgi:hypothetical protein